MSRRNGKTTRMCQAVALYLTEHPGERVTIVGPHVIRNEWYYKNLLQSLGVDLKLVRFVSIDFAKQRGVRALFVDDRFDYRYPQWQKLTVEMTSIEISGGFVYRGESS